MPPVPKTLQDDDGVRSAFQKAAGKYDVPQDLLWGVYGVETDFGRNVQNSSAGAVGPFQFIPPTARAYDYPLTNNPTAAQFEQQADSAAHYLSDLYRETGDWNEAVKRYSGGGYDADAAYKKAGTTAEEQSKSKIPIVGGAIDKVQEANEFAKQSQATFRQFLNLITDIMTWLRFGEGIAGVLLVYFGLKQLTGN